MIYKFKKGYYYKYTRNKIPKNLLLEEEKKIFNNKWYKCIETEDDYIMFENINWYYDFLNYNDFQESKYSPKEKIRKILEEIND
jgi:hypothetical protein